MQPRVVFPIAGSRAWTGGLNYLANALRVVAAETPGRFDAVILAGTDLPEDDLARFRGVPGCEIVRDDALTQSARKSMLLRGLVTGRDRAVATLLDRLEIDVVFESAMFLGWRIGRPAIAWIPDLQHRLRPQMFSRGSRLRREVGFRAQIGAGRAVLVSSEDGRAACHRAYRASKGRTTVIHFAIPAPARIADEDARAVADRYELPADYLFMPNQFWVHKNHRLVIEALQLLREHGQDVTVMATGQQLDSYQPDHAPALLREVERLGLQSQFRAPGLVPYEDIMPLMVASSALLNPSLFEGWSTTVEEGRAAGVPMLLSDLPVHREQMGEEASYFNPHSAVSLAAALSDRRPMGEQERRAARERAAREADRRVAAFAEEFCRLMERSASGS